MAYFGILGPLSVTIDGSPAAVTAARDRTVLAMLLLHPGRIVGVGELTEALWGAGAPSTARGQVQSCVMRLRRALSAETVVSDPAGYGVRVDPAELDALMFDRLLAQARADGDPARFRQALALWRGEALAGVDSPVVRREAAVLDERRAGAIEDWIDAELRAGSERVLIGELTGLVERFPLHERLRGQLMTALYRAGRQAEALAEYRRARQVLIEELGIEPGPGLRALHEQILLGDAAEPVPPSPHPAVAPQRPVDLLPRDVPSFVGRAEQLARLDGLDGTVAVLSGAAGVGKTSLAVHWAHRAGDRFPDGRLYVNLRGFDPDPASAPAPTMVLRGFLESLGVLPDRIPAELEPRAALFRQLLSTRKILVVLDNARDAEQIRPLLPGSTACLTVVTSRSQLAGLIATEDATPVPLDVLTETEATSLLSARLGADRVRAEPNAVAELLRRCAQLPLALAVIAARAAARPKLPLAALAAELADAGLDPFTTDDRASDVRGIFSWSYRALSAPAARLFRLLSIHPGRHLGLHAAASLAGLPLRQTRAVLDELQRVHLVDEQIPGRYSMHDLLRAYATELAVDDPDRHAAAHRLVDHYCAVAVVASGTRRPIEPPPVDPPVDGVVLAPISGETEGLDWFTVEKDALVPMVELAVAESLDRRVWQLAAGLFTHLMWTGNPRGALTVSELALAAALRQHDADATVFSYRAVVGAADGLYTFEERLRVTEEMTSFCAALQDPIALNWAHYSRGLVLVNGGHFDEGTAIVRLVLEDRPDGERLGPWPLTLNLFAWHYIEEEGDAETALSFLTEALAVARKHDIQGIQIRALSGIGLALHMLGRSAEAIAYFEEAEATTTGFLPLISRAKLHNWFGDACADTGDVTRAHHQWWIALEMFETLEDPTADLIRSKLAGSAP